MPPLTLHQAEQSTRGHPTPFRCSFSYLSKTLSPTQHLHYLCCGISARYLPRMEKSRWQHNDAGAAPCSLMWVPCATSSPLPTTLHRAQALAGIPPEGHSRRAGGASLLPCSRRTCRRQRSSVHRQVKISPPKHSSNSWDGQRPAGGVDERLGATTGRCPASTGLHWFAAPLALGTFWLPALLHGWFPGLRGCSVLPSLEPAARPRASPGLTQLTGATLPEGFPMSRGGAP